MTRVRRAAPAWSGIAVVLLLPCVQERTYEVLRVIDGDTIEVDFEGRREPVRYIGIDSPEPSDSRAAVRELADRATDANRSLVGGRRVRLEFDVQRRDRYGRLLAYVWVGDTLVNGALVAAGVAAPVTFPPNVKYTERLLDAARVVWDSLRAHSVRTISAPEARDHVGELARVCGRVESARYVADTNRSPTFLNIGAPYPEQDFTVVVWGEDRDRFADPPEGLAGETVCASGWIESYREVPQIIVRDPEQITVLDG